LGYNDHPGQLSIASYAWKALDEETVSSSSINVFENRLNKMRMTRMGYFMDWF